jgi:hypothetical protein
LDLPKQRTREELNFNKRNEKYFPEYDNWRYACRIYVDNAKCFDKISRCPFSMKLPTAKHFEYYICRINFWGTKKGFDISNKYKFELWDSDV